MPPTREFTFVSRYAFDVTVPGTAVAPAATPSRTVTTLIPARCIASGVKVTSIGSSFFGSLAARWPVGGAGADVVPVCGLAAPASIALRPAAPVPRRSLHQTPPAAPAATSASITAACVPRRQMIRRGRSFSLSPICAP
jgi:hypothetical protein